MINGCTDISACNYLEAANTEDGSCDFCSCGLNDCGCLDIQACNYDDSALYDDDSCVYLKVIYVMVLVMISMLTVYVI